MGESVKGAFMRGCVWPQCDFCLEQLYMHGASDSLPFYLYFIKPIGASFGAKDESRL